MSLLEDVGEKIGKYIILDAFLKNNRTYYVAECEKGHKRTVRSDSLKAKCDICFKCDRQNTLYKTGAYNSWDSMVQRCNNPNSAGYIKYGAAGIRVCDEWCVPNGVGFKNFYSFMGERPEGMTLDRFPDMSGNYEPGNVRWATNSEQGYNQRISPLNSSGRTGVRFNEDHNRWHAMITFNNTLIHLGTFSSYEDAVICREKAELEYFGFNKE